MFPFMTTLKSSLESDFGQMELLPTSSLQDGRVRTFRLRARDAAWTASAQDYGRISRELLARFQPGDCSWRTPQTSLLSTTGETSDVFSGTWPRSGLMLNGIAYRLPPLTHPTSVIASGSSGWLPTPTASRRSGLQSHGVNVINGSINPDWLEWVQGLPIGWTEYGR